MLPYLKFEISGLCLYRSVFFVLTQPFADANVLCGAANASVDYGTLWGVCLHPVHALTPPERRGSSGRLNRPNENQVNARGSVGFRAIERV
jgi:hypothetical protein